MMFLSERAGGLAKPSATNPNPKTWNSRWPALIPYDRND
jgi:hypothetical protein